jgi:hypothetical protein
MNDVVWLRIAKQRQDELESKATRERLVSRVERDYYPVTPCIVGHEFYRIFEALLRLKVSAARAFTRTGTKNFTKE